MNNYNVDHGLCNPGERPSLKLGWVAAFLCFSLLLSFCQFLVKFLTFCYIVAISIVLSHTSWGVGDKLRMHHQGKMRCTCGSKGTTWASFLLFLFHNILLIIFRKSWTDKHKLHWPDGLEMYMNSIIIFVTMVNIGNPMYRYYRTELWWVNHTRKLQRI